MLFWPGVGAAVLGLSSALRPGEPLQWTPVMLRVVTGFVISSLVHRLFRLPALRSLPPPQRWTAIVIVTAFALVATLVVLGNGPTIWRTETTLVPPMMIQPLLEDALQYGSRTSGMPLRVNVRASVNDDWLEVVVANSGRWVPPDASRTPNTGIRSLRRRLELLGDGSATVDVQPDPDHDGGWVRVVIRLPATAKNPPPGPGRPMARGQSSAERGES